MNAFAISFQKDTILTELLMRADTLLAEPPNVVAALATVLRFGDIADAGTLNGSVDRFVFDMLRTGGGGGLLLRP